MPKSAMEAMVVSVTDEVKLLKEMLDEALERIATQESEMRKAVYKKDFRELHDMVEDVRKDTDKAL